MLKEDYSYESEPLVEKRKIKKNIKKKKGWDKKLAAFIAIAIITGIYVIFELSIAVYINSLVLLSDGFHNLSDLTSLGIAYWAQKASKKGQTAQMSYGWVRTEILGGLINACFLLSLCLYVTLESVPKFIQPEPLNGMEDGIGNILFLVVAGSGFIVNLVGTLVFLITGNSHGHSHGGTSSHDHSHKHTKKSKILSEHKGTKKKDLNIHAIFLHYLGDALSSFVVLIAGILLHFFKGTWALYIDPFSSLLIIILILITTIPLIKRCSNILLQGIPQEVNLLDVKQNISKVVGIVSVHELHAWQLVDGMVIGSVHIVLEEGVDIKRMIDEVQQIFHKSGIHSSVIQPEFSQRSPQISFCSQNCIQDCEEDWCCKQELLNKKELLGENSDFETEINS